MTPRRRRMFRDETIAPWATVVVIVAVWWAGATLIPRTGASGPIEPSMVGSSPAAESASSRPATLTPPLAGSPPASPSAPAIVVPAPAIDGGALAVSARGVIVPVAGIDPASLTSTFDQVRGGGTRRHEAMDILAPRGTPVVAAVSGRIVKLFTSAAGGLTVYQFDADEQLCYYYAHLDAYAPDLTEGQDVVRGQVIGYVGTTGNAPPDTPHLHFAIYRLGADKRWWDGEPLDPITFLR